MSNKESEIFFEETSERLKVVIPLQINWFLLLLYSASIVIWIAMLGVVFFYLISGRSSSFVLTAILILWFLVWFWFGRFLFNRWQYQAAKREILFIDRDQLILRRPVSILGITTSYEWEHVSPFYFSDKHHCPAFDYAFLHVYFGESLSETRGKETVAYLNNRYFPFEEEE